MTARRNYATTHAPDTHRPDDWRRQALCRYEDPDLFFPTGNNGPDLLQAKDAKAVCARCPVARNCATWAINTRVEYGIWGGLDETERRTLLPRSTRHHELAPCGTPAAYRRHQRHGEEPCAACRAADSRAKADREAAHKAQLPAEKRPPTITDKCGTSAGYKRHSRDGEEPCAACRAANTEMSRRQRRRQLTGKTEEAA